MSDGNSPKTLRLTRDPKYPRRSAPKASQLDQYTVIVHPLTTGKKLLPPRDSASLAVSSIPASL